VLVNSEISSSYQSSTTSFVNSHDYPIVCNDYAPNGSDNGEVKHLFQDYDERPVFIIINGVANSPSHQQYELLVNERRYGQTEFGTNIVQWRGIMDSVLPPATPSVLEMPRFLADGTFEFLLNGPGTTLYAVEASTNFTDWTTVTNHLPGGSLYREADDHARPRRFYRAAEE